LSVCLERTLHGTTVFKTRSAASCSVVWFISNISNTPFTNSSHTFILYTETMLIIIIDSRRQNVLQLGTLCLLLSSTVTLSAKNCSILYIASLPVLPAPLKLRHHIALYKYIIIISCYAEQYPRFSQMSGIYFPYSYSRYPASTWNKIYRDMK